MDSAGPTAHRAPAHGAADGDGLGTMRGAASQPATPVDFEVPRGACDCLTHIFGDPARFPLSPTRTYTPEPASIEEIEALHRTLGVDRVIIVHPTIYGTDNACTLDALDRLGARARGVAVIDGHTPASALDEMDRAGIRGIRVNLETVGLTDPATARQRFGAAVEQIKGRDHWHIQIYTRPSNIERIYDQVVGCPVPVAFDHFGGTQAAEGMHERGFHLLLALLASGKAYVKLSAPYLVSKQAPDHPDVAPLAKALIAANPERILWGTNWPHPNSGHGQFRVPTEVVPLRRIDDGRILNLLPTWAPDAQLRRTILVDNPARLYGFADAPTTDILE